MFLSTIKASNTNVLPPTVNRMHAAKQIAINIVCHNANGGSTCEGPVVDVRKSSVVTEVSLKSKPSKVLLKNGTSIVVFELLSHFMNCGSSHSGDCEHL